MVNDEVWAAAGLSDEPDSGMLCISCLEQRLGRALVASDFPDIPINRGSFPLSPLLESRIAG